MESQAVLVNDDTDDDDDDDNDDDDDEDDYDDDDDEDGDGDDNTKQQWLVEEHPPCKRALPEHHCSIWESWQ